MPKLLYAVHTKVVDREHYPLKALPNKWQQESKDSQGHLGDRNDHHDAQDNERSASGVLAPTLAMAQARYSGAKTEALRADGSVAAPMTNRCTGSARVHAPTVPKIDPSLKPKTHCILRRTLSSGEGSHLMRLNPQRIR
ncbi:hypothetical protein [Steroidobacter cummioxidans]|uniref:hypothetical protein n=1 Tax=Steroidobacter cummioxidans TaxID=1803913 RepID=UPI0012907741|nr:hypothetical protein [Steroidobacter cummioxidans]